MQAYKRFVRQRADKEVQSYRGIFAATCVEFAVLRTFRLAHAIGISPPASNPFPLPSLLLLAICSFLSIKSIFRLLQPENVSLQPSVEFDGTCCACFEHRDSAFSRGWPSASLTEMSRTMRLVLEMFSLSCYKHLASHLIALGLLFVASLIPVGDLDIPI